MYKLFLCLRYLRKRRIAFFAVAAVCLCSAMVLIVISVMGGFLNMITDRSRGMLGDLIIENETLQGFPYYQEFIGQIKSDMAAQIEEATPVIITYGVLRFPKSGRTKPVQVVGVRLDETYRVNEFKNGLFYEKYYPGSTSLADQQEPRYGLGPDDMTVLPAELEAARRKWQAGASPEEINEAWRYGVFVFEMDAGSYPRELDRRTLSAEFRQAMASHFYTLPEKVEVRVVKRGSKWLLWHRGAVTTLEKDRDPESGAEKLRIYDSPYTGPGFHLGPPRDAETLDPTWYGRPLPGIIMGTDLCAERLRTGGYRRFCYRGEQVQLTLVPFSDRGIISETTGMPSRLMRYNDDCRTGVYDVDSMSVYVDFALLQHVVDMDAQEIVPDGAEGDPASAPAGGPARPKLTTPARTTQIQIKLKPGVNAQAAKQQIQKAWTDFAAARAGDLRDAPEVLERISGPMQWVIVQTWAEKQQRYIAAVEKEKYLVTALFGVISLVAVFLVGVIFYMIVQQKTHDIGIIKSVGATSTGVASIFLSYGAAVGVVGGALGTVIGIIFVWYINEIQEFLIWIHPSAQVWNPEVYAFDRIPNQVNPWDAVVIYAVAIFASMLGSLIAAVRAARVWPVEALRYE